MRIYRGLEFITESGIVAGADNYLSIPENGVAGNFNAFELQGRPDALGDPVGRISMISNDAGTDVEVFRIEVKNEPISPRPYTASNDTGIMTTWHKNGLGWRRGLQTDGNTLFFGYNPNDTNAGSGSILNPNSSGYYALSALRAVLSGADCTDLLALGYTDACPAMDSVLIGSVDNIDWVNIATNTGPTAAGVMINPAGPTGLASGIIRMSSSSQFGWGSTANTQTSTIDTALTRLSAGIIDFSTGSGMLFPSGTSAAPAVAGRSMTTTGMSWAAGPQLQFSISATLVGYFTNTGQFVLPLSSGLLNNGSMSLVEMTAPAGVTNRAVIFAEDNGSGKTRLMVQMPTGAAIQLAIEA